jgi:uncharacterized protein (DUF2267 family)
MTNTPNRESGGPEELRSAERFLAHIERSGVLPPTMTPAEAASAALCVLSRRVTGGEAEDLREAMPGPLRYLFERCPRDRADPPEVFDRQGFLRRVAEQLAVAPSRARSIALAVFEALQEEVPSVGREIDDVESQLPADLKDLWRVRLAR